MAKSSKGTKRASMQDVADLAGVSRTTVSFVINDVAHNNNIPSETQERVWTAVEQLGYRPNAIARGLRSQRTQTIGFISDEIVTKPHAGRIIQGAQDLAWEQRYMLLVVNTGRHEDLKRAAMEMMLDRQVDGLIYATMYHREVHPPEAIRQLPAVLLDCFVADRSLPSVVPDEVAGGSEATEYLLAKGHRRIGYINNNEPIPATFGRLQGYREALATHGIPFEESLVVTGVTDAHGGYDCALELMEQAERPTAIFCFNDRMAMGVYDALRKLNLRVPDDVAVIGFDNEQLIADQLYPGLTTMALPQYAMGQWAVRQLLALLERSDGRHQPPLQQKMVCPLVIRESV